MPSLRSLRRPCALNPESERRIAPKIEAAAPFPSEAMRMGTLPIVAPTGGLKDTVEAGPDASQLRPRGLNNWNRVPLKGSIRVSTRV